MLNIMLVQFVLAGVNPVHAEMMNVQEFRGAQIELIHGHSMSQGSSVLDLALNDAEISFCSLDSAILRELPAGMVLTIDAVENGRSESTFVTHTGEGAGVNVTCINFGQADLDDVRQAFHPSARVISPNLAAEYARSN